jgi:hypothetical protein
VGGSTYPRLKKIQESPKKVCLQISLKPSHSPLNHQLLAKMETLPTKSHKLQFMAIKNLINI